MPPRGHGRRKIGKASTAGKASAKKSIKSSSPSITLQEILDNLSIQFDKDIGLLNGEFTRNVPQIPTLESLRKLLVKLNDQLEIVSNHDELTIEQVKRQLKLIKGELKDDEDVEMDESDVFTAEATPLPKGPESNDKEEDNNNDKNDDDDNDDDDNNNEDNNDQDNDVKMEDIGTSPKSKTTEDIEDEDIKKEDQEDDSKDQDDKPLAETSIQDTTEKSTKDEDVLVDIPKDDLKTTPSKRKLSHQEEIENDPSVRNPKSEFVTSQTLPAAAIALGLFSDKNNGGLEESGDEYLKKKYAVSSYPKNDLKNLLPGSIPNIDFSKNKPNNQVQFTTFQTFIENFYRNFTEDDLKFLKNKFILTDQFTNDSNYDPQLTPYLIPNLGPLYSMVWNEEENSNNYSPPPTRITQDSILPKNSSTDLNDDVLETEDVSCGPLVSRLLSAILKDDKGNENGSIDVQNNGTSNNNDDDINISAQNNNEPRTSTSALPEQQGWKVSSVNADYNSLEDRLKRELKYIGIFMNLNANNNGNNNNSDNKDDDEDQEPDWLNPQDDEVSTELRQLQNELKSVSRKNNKRKKELLPIIENQLAWQEYLSILDDLDKQVDSAYLKRIRVPKNKKKKTTSSNSNSNSHGSSIPPSVQIQLQAQQAHQAAANSAIKSLLEKRIRWVNKIGPLFEKTNGESMKRIPKDSVFTKGDVDEDDDEDYEDGEDLVLQQQQ